MTYSRDKIAGLSVVEAIGMICAAAMDAERWAAFEGCIELSAKQAVSVGGDYHGWWHSLGEKPPGYEPDVYAAALRPLFDDLAAGELVIRGAPVGDDTKDAEAIKARAWCGGWKLILDGQEAILRRPNNSGKDDAEYNLESIQDVRVNPSQTAHGRPEVVSVAKVHPRPRRGPAKDDEPFYVLMETKIRAGQSKGPWSAAGRIIEEGAVKIGNAEKDSVQKRLANGYKKTDRPQTTVEVGAEKSLATQK